METTYDVRIHKTDVYKGSRTTTYKVRWKVNGKPFKRPFKTTALADSFRSQLVAAARKGEAFFVDSGLPISAERPTTEISWYDFATAYVDMKWKGAAATYRRTIGEAMTAATLVMVGGRGKPEDKIIRSALNGWAFNTIRRQQPEHPEQVAEVLSWIKRNSRPVKAAARQELARALHNAVTSKLDGTPLAKSVARQRRMILVNALDHAVRLGYLNENPVRGIKWQAPKPTRAVDRRRVPNPIQARTLLAHVREAKISGPRLVACFGSMYFAALRPEEAVDLRDGNLTLSRKWDEDKESWVYDWGETVCREGASSRWQRVD